MKTNVTGTKTRATTTGARAKKAAKAAKGAKAKAKENAADTHGATQAELDAFDRSSAQQTTLAPRDTHKQAQGAISQADLRVRARTGRVPHTEIRNPISWDECPDPTVMKVGNDFFIANTRPQPQNYKPGEAAYPLRKAVNGDFNNLVDVGHVFPAGKAPAWLHVDPWAPEFHHDDELGYMVTFTGRNKDGKLCIGMAFADKPEGPYAEKTPGPFLVHPEIGVIDSHVYMDETTGKRMFLWKEDWNDRPGAKKTTPLLMQELKVVDGVLKLVGKRTQTIENDLPFEHDLVEGASIIKRGEHHYMFYSAGPYYNGNYVTSVARARSVDGPWEKLGKNVMPNDEHWEGRGHGYVAQDKHGNDYFVCHGYPKGDYAKRVLLMFPIHWEGGWPRVDTKTPVRDVELANAKARDK